MEKLSNKSFENYIFFSIIIPACNEERYIGKTLKHLKELNYPQDKFEVIVVENGSSDRTYEIAKTFSFAKTYSIDSLGVSKAKNFGASKISKNSEWIIFLDADTILKKDFLIELNEFIKNHEGVVNIATSLKPLSNSFKAKAWFDFYNFGRFVVQGSMSIQIVKVDVFNKIKFDENLTFNEDLTLIKKSKRFGKFAFLWTENVYTSTRRFDKVGYLKQFLLWVWWNIIPERYRREVKYEIIR